MSLDEEEETVKREVLIQSAVASRGNMLVWTKGRRRRTEDRLTSDQ